MFARGVGAFISAVTVGFEPVVTALDAHGSLAWIAHPDEWMERASAALVVAGATYLVDPVDTPHLDAWLVGLPPVQGVLRLLNRHGRDADSVARRLGADLVVAYDGVGTIHPELVLIPVADCAGWREVAIWMPGRRVLVVAETLGTVGYFHARDGARLGMHPVIRTFPPRAAFAGLDPVAIAVGHGPPLIDDDAGPLMDDVLAAARRDLPRAWWHAAALGMRRRRS